MPDEFVAQDGKLYASSSAETLINDDDFQIADFRGGSNLTWEETLVTWRGQKTTLKGAQLTRHDFGLAISEVAFRTESLGELLEVDPERLASAKRVTAIVAGGTEATLTCEPETDEAFEENDQVIVSDRLGRFKEGYIDATLTDTSAKVDDGAGAAVAGIDDIGIMADVAYGTPQYFTRADDVLLDIGDAQDYSCMIWFERQRQSSIEVLMGKTDDQADTAAGTTAGWVLYIDADGILHFAVNDGVADGFYVLNGTTVIPEGEMHCVVVTFDESSAADCKIYLDGLDDTLSRTGTLSDIGDCSNALVFSIGAESDGGVPFDGFIAGAAVWDNIVLTAANALTIATTPLTEPTGTPTSWWTFYDLAAATTIADEATAANSFDLTLVGGTTTNFGTHSRVTKATLTANLLGFDHMVDNYGIGGWAAGDAASQITKDKQYRKFGPVSLRVKNTDASQAFARATVTTIAGIEYHFHGWFRSPLTPAGAAQLVNVDATAALGITVTQAGATTGSTWYEVEFDFEAADTSTTIDLGSGSTSDTEIGYWDSVQIYKNFVDAGGFETNIAGSDWATTGTPDGTFTVDDADTAEDSGTLCYQINTDDATTRYVSQDVTVVVGIEYTFTGRVQCGTAEKGVVVLSGAQATTTTLDNGAETTNYVTVRNKFTAATTTLTIKIYGDGEDALFDNFSVSKINTRRWDFNQLIVSPEIKFMEQYLDGNGKINQLYYDSAKIRFGSIGFTNEDYVVHDIEVMPLDDMIYIVET